VERPTDAIFARIARRYDLINRLLAAGRDQAWRRSVIQCLPPGRVLDLGAGTGAAVPLFGGRQVVALDPVSQMLDLNPTAARVVGRGEGLPFREASFDSVFSAFVFRNLHVGGPLAKRLQHGEVAAKGRAIELEGLAAVAVEVEIWTQAHGGLLRTCRRSYQSAFAAARLGGAQAPA